MPRPPALAVCRSADAAHWRLQVLPVSLAAVALGTMIGGVSLLVLHARVAQAELILAPAGIVLLVCSLVQWRAAWQIWNRRHARREALVSWHFLRQLCLAVVLAYVGALLVGPVPYVECGLLAAIVVWYTLLLLPLIVAPDVIAGWVRWSQVRVPRRAGASVLVTSLCVLTAEAGLRAYRFAEQRGLFAAGRDVEPADSIADFALAGAGQVPLTSGRLRVAVLADGATCRARRDDYVVQVERALPGVKIVPIDLQGPWSAEPAAAVAQRLADAQVDLVLATLSVCDDLTREAPAASWFDWRQFELAKLAGAAPAATAAAAPRTADDFESFCRLMAPQLAACRTPIEPQMHERWERTFGAVDELLSQCSAMKVAVTLVLVPGEFQVNHALRETLKRRSGYAAQQLDVELPQRKLASFAANRQLPLIDLLPSLRLCEASPYERNADAWSDVGHAAAAKAIGGWLESRYGRQLGVSTRLTSAP